MSLFIRGSACVLLLGISLSLRAATSSRLGTDTEAPPQRLALLIGNSTYQHVPKLKNPKHDVDQLAARLRQLGFHTDVQYDLNHDNFVAAISDFENKIEPGAIVLFYYSGHGVQVGGINYLIPVSMPSGANAATLTGNGISVNWIRQNLDAAKLSLIILDACRTLPNIPAKGPTQGLAPLFARGSLIAYAADEGQAASDNDAEDLSLFTKHLITELTKSDETLCQLFGGVRAAVDVASAHVQFPFVYDGVIGDFVFNRTTTGESRKLSDVSTKLGSAMVWTTIQDSDNPNDFAAFLAYRVRDANHSQVAEKRLRSLMSTTAKAVGVLPLGPQEAPELVAAANQGARLFYEKDYAQALETYETLVHSKSSDVSLLYDYATCLLHLGRHDEAIHFFDKVVALDPDFPWAYYNRGVAQHLSGRFSQAIEDYDRALERRPGYALGYNNRALAKRDAGNAAGAERDAQKAIALDPNYAPAFFNSAQISLALGNATAAAQAVRAGEILTIPKTF